MSFRSFLSKFFKIIIWFFWLGSVLIIWRKEESKKKKRETKRNPWRKEKQNKIIAW
jgi:hypothetical protein